jgi:putative exporter of polyketide antibiotics
MKMNEITKIKWLIAGSVATVLISAFYVLYCAFIAPKVVVTTIDMFGNITYKEAFSTEGIIWAATTAIWAGLFGVYQIEELRRLNAKS